MCTFSNRWSKVRQPNTATQAPILLRHLQGNKAAPSHASKEKSSCSEPRQCRQ